MPVEIIGQAATPGASREWINAECEMAIKHLKRVCEEPPPEMELEVQWQEHHLGTYPLIALVWEDAMRGAPWEYIEKCEVALTEYDTEVSNFLEGPEMARLLVPQRSCDFFRIARDWRLFAVINALTNPTVP